MFYIHRYAYILFVDKYINGFRIKHKCKNRNCCNPKHMEAVTPKTNTNRGENYRRNQTHCIHGHEFTFDNTYIDKIGRRHCRICKKNAQIRFAPKRLQWQRNNRDKVRGYNRKNYLKRKTLLK